MRRSRRSSRAVASSSSRSGSCSSGSRAFFEPDPRDGLATWMATVFGALYVSLLSFVIRLEHAAPVVPAGPRSHSIGAERGWLLLLILAVWSYDTGAYLTGKTFGRHKFLTHISPSKTIEGLVGGVVATTVVVTILLWGLGQPPLHGLLLGPLVALVAQAGDLAESDAQARGRREGLRDVHPRPRRDAGPRRFVPVRRPDRDPVCRRPPLLSGAAVGGRGSRSSARRGASGRRPSRSSRRTPSGSRSWPSRPARTRPSSPSRPLASRSAVRSLGGDPDALSELASAPDVDLVVVATGGVVSLRPVLAALRAGKVVATANKETLVAGGPPGHARGPGPRYRGPRPPTHGIPRRARCSGSARSTRSTRRCGSAWWGSRSPTSTR